MPLCLDKHVHMVFVSIALTFVDNRVIWYVHHSRPEKLTFVALEKLWGSQESNHLAQLTNPFSFFCQDLKAENSVIVCLGWSKASAKAHSEVDSFIGSFLCCHTTCHQPACPCSSFALVQVADSAFTTKVFLTICSSPIYEIKSLASYVAFTKTDVSSPACKAGVVAVITTLIEGVPCEPSD